MHQNKANKEIKVEVKNTLNNKKIVDLLSGAVLECLLQHKERGNIPKKENNIVKQSEE